MKQTRCWAWLAGMGHHQLLQVRHRPPADARMRPPPCAAPSTFFTLDVTMTGTGSPLSTGEQGAAVAHTASVVRRSLEAAGLPPASRLLMGRCYGGASSDMRRQCLLGSVMTRRPLITPRAVSPRVGTHRMAEASGTTSTALNPRWRS